MSQGISEKSTCSVSASLSPTMALSPAVTQGFSESGDEESHCASVPMGSLIALMVHMPAGSKVSKDNEYSSPLTVSFRRLATRREVRR